MLALALTYLATNDRRYRTPLIAFGVAEVALGLFLAQKTEAVLPLGYVALAYIVVRRRLPIRGIVLGIIFTLFFIVPANQFQRNLLRGQQQATAASAFGASVSRLPPLNPFSAVTKAVNYVATRFRSIDSVALIHSRTPSLFPYADGKLYAELPAIILIPRAVWPGKPSLNSALDFSRTYYELPPSVQSENQITQIGDLYRNFGYIGVVLGLFAWGLVLGCVTLARQRWQSPRGQFVYLYAVIPAVIAVETDLPELIATVTKALPVVALLAVLLLPAGGEGRGRLESSTAPRL